MYTFGSSVFIKRALEEVFEFVTNPANNCLWQTGVSECGWMSEGPPRVGSTLRMVRTVLGQRAEVTFQLTHWEPPHRAISKAHAGPVPIETTMEFRTHRDGTLFTLSGQAQVSGMLKLMARSVGRQAEAQLEADLAALKALLEDGQG